MFINRVDVKCPLAGNILLSNAKYNYEIAKKDMIMLKKLIARFRRPVPQKTIQFSPVERFYQPELPF